MRFLIDEQLPPALATWLAGQGHEAERVYQLGLLGCSDAEIGRLAVERAAVIVTKDEDFTLMRQDLQLPQVPWLRIGNVGNRVLLERLSAHWPDAVERLQAGEALAVVEPQ